MKTKHFLTGLFFISCVASPLTATAQKESSIFTQRGLVRAISSEADPYLNDKYHMMVTLRGTGERAVCQKIKLNEFDTPGIEVLKISLLLNRPVEISYHIVRGKAEDTAENPLHCMAESILFKPE